MSNSNSQNCSGKNVLIVNYNNDLPRIPLIPIEIFDINTTTSDKKISNDTFEVSPKPIGKMTSKNDILEVQEKIIPKKIVQENDKVITSKPFGATPSLNINGSPGKNQGLITFVGPIELPIGIRFHIKEEFGDLVFTLGKIGTPICDNKVIIPEGSKYYKNSNCILVKRTMADQEFFLEVGTQFQIPPGIPFHIKEKELSFTKFIIVELY